ncbi:MAG: Ig-like domain-containing protein [Saprospiraceae bacterium]|nr:Ig-like domain-containing protein [Saprospiraceae bacterium]
MEETKHTVTVKVEKFNALRELVLLKVISVYLFCLIFNQGLIASNVAQRSDFNSSSCISESFLVNSNCQIGNLYFERWTSISGSSVSDLTSNANYPDSPTETGYISSFQGPVNYTENYGTRVRGYIIPSESGMYTFNVTGDDNTIVYLSSDTNEANKSEIASVTSWSNITEHEKSLSQTSSSIYLEEGESYFVELLHKEGGGGDHFQVYWKTPSQSVTWEIIPGQNLFPYGCTEICDNGLDDDGDGNVDCEDKDCGFIQNREFDNGLDNWILWNETSPTNNSTLSLDQSYQLSGGNSAKIDINTISSPPTNWYIQLQQLGLSIENQKTYLVSFDAKAEYARSIVASIQLNESPWTTYFWEEVNLTTTPTTYQFEFVGTQTQLNNIKFYFALGSSLSDVWIDNVQLKEICVECFADAGPDQTQCQNAVFEVNASTEYAGAIGTWSVVSGEAYTQKSWNEPKNTFTIPPGTTTLRWTVASSGNCSEFDEITLTNTSSCSVDCIDPLNINGDLEDNGTISSFPLSFNTSSASLIGAENNPAGWAERYGPNNPNTATFNGAYYINTSNNTTGDAHSGSFVNYLKGSTFCLSPLSTNAGLVCGKTYQFSVWVAAYTYQGTQGDAPFALEFFASSNSGTPELFAPKVELLAPASTSWNDLNWNRYVFEFTLPESGYDWSDFAFTTYSDDHGIVIDDLCITVLESGSEALAGADQSACSNIFNLQANIPPTGYSGSWSVLEGDISLSSLNTSSTVATLNSGNLGTIMWTVSDGICSSSDRLVLSYEALPPITPNNADVCVGESVEISVGGCSGDLLWVTGETTSSITVTPASSRSYSVTCTDVQSSNIVLNGNFETSSSIQNWQNGGGAIITTDPAHVHSGNNAALIDASSNWGGMDQSISIVPGESFTASFWGKTNNPNKLAIAGLSFLDNSWQQISDVNEVEVYATEYQQYTLSGVAPSNAAYVQIGFGASSPSKFYVDDVEITKGINCERTANVSVTVLDLPTVSASNDGPLTCDNTNVLLTALPSGMNYSWSGGGSAQTKSVSAPGTYYVTITDENGCESIASTVVTTNYNGPNASAIANGAISCNVNNVTLTAYPAGLTYAWSGGGTGQTKSVSVVGEYTVTVTGTNGCPSVVSVNVIPDNKPPLIVIDDVETCEGETVILSPELCEYYPDIEAQRLLPQSGWNNTYGDQRSPLSGDGELCFILDSVNLASAQMIGLNDDYAASDGYTDLDFAMYFYVRTTQNRVLIQIREGGAYKGIGYDGPPVFGAEYCIRRTGSTIEYLMDGNVIFTSAVNSSGDLYYDHTFYSGDGIWSTGYSSFKNFSVCGDVELQYEWSNGATTKTINADASGQYALTVTDAKGCSSNTIVDVEIYSNPIVSILNDGPITCADPVVTLTAQPSGMSYLWGDGSTNSTLDVTTSGSYNVTVTNGDMCTNSATTIVSTSDNPIVEVTGPTNLCLGETSTLSPSSGGVWTSSNTEVAIVANDGSVASIGPGTAFFTFTDDGTGCASEPTELITVNPELSVSIDNESAICVQSGSELIAVPSGGTAPYLYSWSGPNGLSSNAQALAVSESGNYYLTITDDAGCTAETSGFVYEQYDPYIFTLNTEVCEGEDVNLSVNSGSAVSYQWSTNAGNAITSSINVIPSPPSSTYFVTVTNNLGCTTIASAEITVHPKIAVSISGGTDICIGETSQLAPTSGGTWVSSNTSVAGVSNSGLVTALNQGSATFTFIESGTNCESDPTTPITVNPKTTVSVTGPTILCEGETTTLSPTTGGTWVSSDELIATVTNDGVVTSKGEGTVSFTYTNSSTGCVSDATSSITIHPTPTVTVTGPSTICIGDQTFITPTSGGMWTSSNTNVATISNTGVITGVSAGTAEFTFINSFGCPGDISGTVTVDESIEVTLIGENILCEGEAQILTASVAGGTWSSNNTSIASVDPNSGEVVGIADGNVIVTYSNSSSGCYSDAEMPLEIKSKPTGFISGSVNICVGEYTTLTSSTTGYWTSSDTDIAIVSNNGDVVGISGGTATFTFTADNNCSSVETGTLTVNPDINVDIDFGSSVCLEENMQLTANVSGGTPNYQYSWNGPGGFASDQQIIDITINGNYNLVVTDDAGCSTNKSAFVYAAYEPFIFALNTEVCEGESVTLSVNSSSVASYEWSPNTGDATEQSVSVIPSYPSSTYFVTVTNNEGCTTVASAEITVFAVPEVEVEGNTTICEGSTTTLSPSSGGYWTSSDNSVATVTDDGVVTGVSSGTATFTFRDAISDCLSEETESVTVGNNTPVSINGNNTLCQGEVTTFTASVAGGTWSSSNPGVITIDLNGEANPIAQGTATLIYTIQSGACYQDGSLEVTVNDVPSININGPSTICEGEQTYLIPTSGGTWASSDPTVAIVSNFGVVTGVSGGTASFTFTSAYGCTKTLATPISVLASPEVSFAGPSNICINETTTLSPSSGGIWVSSNSNIATVNSSGIVTGKKAGSVTFTFIELANGCMSDDILTVTVNPKPTVTAPELDELCIGETTSISPTEGGTWTSTNSLIASIGNDGTITAVGPGAVSFIFTNSITGCSSSESLPIVVNEKPTTILIGPDELCIGETSTISPLSGGIWSSSNVSLATIDNQGTITAVGSGDVQFLFTSNSTGCMSDSSVVVTINEPTEVEFIGDDQICVGEMTSLSPSSGGTWASSNENVASVSNSGLVTANAPGVVTFTFISNEFCNSIPTSELQIDPNPVITYNGPTNICVGESTNLLPTTGGTWSSSNQTIATISNAGEVVAVGAGSVHFTFTSSTTGCSSTTITSLNVYTPPSISISGQSELCVGQQSSMSPSSGGIWLSNNPEIASISTSGLITAINEGTATFTFIEDGTGCQSTSTEPIIVLPKPTVTIEGENALCVGETTTLSPNSGGSWISSNPAAATVTDEGIVEAVSQGIARFTFISDEGCSSNQTAPVIVIAAPSILIEGSDLLCVGDQTQLLPSNDGTWESSNNAIATISNSGLVTALTSGEVVFTYTDTNTGCVSDESEIVTINEPPTITILGPDDICVGGSTNLTPTDGGIWESLNPEIATVSNEGEVIGVSVGTTSFIFTELASGCSSVESDVITVSSGPGISFIGDTELCIGEYSSISPTTGGSWISTNPAVAQISNDGIIEAISQGSANFIFTQTESGCISELSATLQVNGAPTVIVTGNTEICIGSLTTLSPNSGGSWTSLNPSIASVTSDGIITGVSAGVAAFVFEDTETGCITDGSTTISVIANTDVSILGDDVICLGYTTSLFPTSGGIWVSSNPAIATVSSSGIVTGIAPGKVSFEFINTSAGCTEGNSTDEITVRSCLNHDYNVTIADEVITGDLSTNDNISENAIYSNTPILISKPLGSLPDLTVNADGSYEFLSSKKGKYLYFIPVCLPPYGASCPKSVFEINVVDNIYSEGTPVSNLEFATTYMGVDETVNGIEIDINTLENDACIFTGGCSMDDTSVAILKQPNNGTATIGINGIISYSSNPGFIGQDTLEYEVCMDSGLKCSQSTQVITVNHNSAVNSTVPVDDFGYILKGELLTGNVINNDSDPEGDNISVVPMGSLIAPISINGGTYYIDGFGNYTFTPDEEFIGSTEFVYTLCDDNSVIACTDATMHILVFDDMSLHIRVYLEGALMQNNGAVSTTSGFPLMRDDLRVNPFTGENFIPTDDPYTYMRDQFMNTPSKFNKLGPGLLAENIQIEDSLTVFSVTGDNAIVDWVHVELRSKDDMLVPIATRSGLLQRDGDIVDLDGSSLLKFKGINVDSFYVVVKHRSHLGVMSQKVSNSDLIDFTSPDFETFNYGTSKGDGNNYTGLSQKSNVVNGFNALWAGDFDSNGKVKFSNPDDDQNIMFVDVLFNSPEFLINYNNAFGYLTGDFNMDGKTKYTNPSDDLNYLFSQLLLYPNNVSFLSNFNSMIEQVPE